MSTRTLRGLAAGAGAAAILFAGAAGASAIPGQPQESFWEDHFAGQGYENVTCFESVVNGAPGILTLNIDEEAWSSHLPEGSDWIGVVIKVANDYDVKAWAGYGDYVFEGDVPGGSEGNITHAYICQAPSDDGGDNGGGVTPGDGDETEEPTDPGDGDETEEPTDPGDGDETEEPTDPEETTEPGDEDGDDDNGKDDGDDNGKDDDEKPTGPPVETDGPATPSGPNMGLMGGAALLLGGAGAAGWAMRRRAGEH